MAFEPLAPTIAHAPVEVAPDTFVIQQIQPACGQPLFVYINSLVIRGEQPMIVDTGTPANRTQWMHDVFSLVEPEDVQWIYVSHDDVDHSGNLAEVLDLCPNATLVCTWAMVERHTNCMEFPLARCRWVNDGESFDIGDRVVTAMRPPVFDSPTTRGLWDSSTGLYWAVDTFATPLPEVPALDTTGLDPDFWRFGMTLFALGAVSPWMAYVDAAKFNRHVDRIQGLGASVIACCHSPALRGQQIDDAFALVRELPSAPPPELPDQLVLEQIVAAMTAA